MKLKFSKINGWLIFLITEIIVLVVIGTLGIIPNMNSKVSAGTHDTGIFGWVGIGTDTPLRKLHVYGDAVLFQRDADSAGFIIQRTETNRWVLGVNENPDYGHGFVISTYPVNSGPSVPRLMVDLDGNVGIGTLKPQQMLDVAGTVQATAFTGDGSGLSGITLGNSSVKTSMIQDSAVTDAKIGSVSWNKITGTPSGFADGIDNDTVAGLSATNGQMLQMGPTGWQAGNDLNQLQVAQLRWYDANKAGNKFATGSFPAGICFDGASIWVTNAGGDTVNELRASDGSLLGTYSVGDNPRGICFDGANIWVANQYSDNVSKLRASDGSLLGTYAVGTDPNCICFDGANIWVTNYSSDNVSKLRARDGSLLGTYAVGSRPLGVCFDGANIWVVNSLSATVSKLRASDGVLLNNYVVGSWPKYICFDGANIWVTNAGARNVSKLRASDGFVLGTYSVGWQPEGICFDGANIWVLNYGDQTVNKLRAIDGFLLGTFGAGDLSFPGAICFDGANIWVVNQGSNSVSKM
jgi:hypothetical protein